MCAPEAAETIGEPPPPPPLESLPTSLGDEDEHTQIGPATPSSGSLNFAGPAQPVISGADGDSKGPPTLEHPLHQFKVRHYVKGRLSANFLPPSTPTAPRTRYRTRNTDKTPVTPLPTVIESPEQGPQTVWKPDSVDRPNDPRKVWMQPRPSALLNLTMLRHVCPQGPIRRGGLLSHQFGPPLALMDANMCRGHWLSIMGSEKPSTGTVQGQRRRTGSRKNAVTAKVHAGTARPYAKRSRRDSKVTPRYGPQGPQNKASFIIERFKGLTAMGCFQKEGILTHTPV